MKRIAAVAAALSVLVLTGCSSTEDTPSTQPVVAVQDEQPAAAAEAQRQVVTPTPEPVVEAAAFGEDVEVGDKGTMKIRPLDQPGVYAVEIYTTGLQEFPGTWVGEDSAGAHHVAVRLGAEQFAAGGPGREIFTSNGVGGDQLTFDTSDIVSVTYVPVEGTPITWSV